ncbi:MULTISPECIES: hypothetical protein [unclassified Variovorax]|uniref:hypothetical protein n=1 Tax=unclassified Variovorax TaxID=663243 RepID=UPI003F451B7C
MINGYPTREELENRIVRQLNWHEESDEVALLWRGYLSGLLEWGVIEVSIYDALIKLLPAIGVVELHELFADEPITPDQNRELSNYSKKE